MFIARATNTGPSEWTKPFGHDLCICWDTKNQFTLREFLASGEWRYPPNPFPAGLEAFLAEHEPFRSMSEPGTAFSLTGALGGTLALEVFMQMVFKSGWAVRKVQDRIDDLAARTDHVNEDDDAETLLTLESLRDIIRSRFFTPEDWFMAIHYAADGKTEAKTSPAGSRDLQEPVRIPESNYQPTVLGASGVQYPPGIGTREYVYNMSHHPDLGYLNDQMAMVLDPRDTRFVPFAFHANPATKSGISNARAPRGGSSTNVGHNSVTSGQTTPTRGLPRQQSGRDDRRATDDVGAAGGGGSAGSGGTSRRPGLNTSARTPSTSQRGILKTPGTQVDDHMLASKLFSSPVTKGSERVTSFSASVSRPGSAPQ
jgi:hypothetical protein